MLCFIIGLLLWVCGVLFAVALARAAREPRGGER